ncbi:MAG: BrnA antitoxin family protein [Acidobacteriaceae bacterium]
MASLKPLVDPTKLLADLTDDEGEVRELTEEDLKHFVPFSELPPEHQAILRGLKRGAQKAPTKQLISIRLSQDVVREFRSTGRGWQARMDAALKEWLQNREKRSA